MVEILKYCIPALCVLLATWLVMRQFYKAEADKRLWELKRLSQKEISPLRLRAYERLTLLLERTTPEHMLLELNLGEDIKREYQKFFAHAEMTPHLRSHFTDEHYIKHKLGEIFQK